MPFSEGTKLSLLMKVSLEEYNKLQLKPLQKVQRKRAKIFCQPFPRLKESNCTASEEIYLVVIRMERECFYRLCIPKIVQLKNF